MTAATTRYVLRSPDGGDLPPFEAGAHIDVVVAPEFLRQFSLSGDPADRSCYEIGVLREDEGRGGSKLLHRIFSKNRRVFVTPPLNHFPLDETAPFSLLMAGGIGVTPLIAMAHRLNALGKGFALHYSCKSRSDAGYLETLASAPWAKKVHLHFSDEGSRADLDALMRAQPKGTHLYTCGPDRYMNAVLETATAAGWDEERLHREYFSVPEQPDYINHPFTIELARSGRRLEVPVDKSITDVLAENGVHVDVKCSDGLCGVCKCGVLEGEVEHRDFVLSKAQKADQIILCQSRATKKGGVLRLDI
jgi:ferredoxin-NADP reductase